MAFQMFFMAARSFLHKICSMNASKSPIKMKLVSLQSRLCFMIMRSFNNLLKTSRISFEFVPALAKYFSSLQFCLTVWFISSIFKRQFDRIDQSTDLLLILELAMIVGSISIGRGGSFNSFYCSLEELGLSVFYLQVSLSIK